MKKIIYLFFLVNLTGIFAVKSMSLDRDLEDDFEKKFTIFEEVMVQKKRVTFSDEVQVYEVPRDRGIEPFGPVDEQLKELFPDFSLKIRSYIKNDYLNDPIVQEEDLSIEEFIFVLQVRAEMAEVELVDFMDIVHESNVFSYEDKLEEDGYEASDEKSGDESE